MTHGALDQSRCDVALRPRGRAAHGPRKAQLTRRWRGHVQEATRSTRTLVRGATWRGGGHAVHADACEGRHMARGLACEGPTG